MNLLKATLATAAVTVCCLGNDYPARADYSSFMKGYDYGFLYGSVGNACMNYHFGYISRSVLLQQLRAANEQDETTPAIRNLIVGNFERPQGARSAKSCLPYVRSVFGNGSYSQTGYES